MTPLERRQARLIRRLSIVEQKIGHWMAERAVLETELTIIQRERGLKA